MSALRRLPWPSPLTPRRRRALASEIEEELQAHLALRAEENEREGMDPEAALADARARFGDFDEIHSACLDAEADHPIRLAGRVVLRVGMLAVGFGAVALAFALVQSALIQPLRFPDADRLVRFGEGWGDARVQASTFQTWREQSASFEALIAFNAREHTLTRSGLPVQVRAMQIGEGYFDVFGVDPVVGRTFAPDETEATPRPVVLLSEALWERRFRRAPSVLGRSLRLDGHSYTVVGVIPEQGQLSHGVDVWTPLPLDPARPSAMVYVVGRLRDGRTLDQARAELASIELAVADPAVLRTSFNPLHDLYAAPLRSTILLLLAVSALILVLVWATLFRRTFDRSPLGRASGVSRPSRAWLEAFALTAAGAVLGGALATGVHRLTYDALFDRAGTLFAPPGAALLGVVGVLMAVTAVGLVAAQQMAGWREAVQPWRRWAEQGLVVGSTAALVVVLAVVVQQHRTVWAEPTPAHGWDDRGLYVADLAVSGDWVVAGSTARMNRVLDRVRGLPGVEAASIGWAVPFHSEHRLVSHPVDLLSDAPARRMTAAVDLMAEAYLETLRVALVEGREAAAAGPESPAREAMVNASFAAQAWPGETALGQRIDVGADGLIRTVVGVVEDVHYATRAPQPPVVYIPVEGFELAQGGLIVRAPDLGASGLSVAVRRAAFQADAEMAVTPLRAVGELRAEAEQATMTRLRLLAGMAGLGLVCVLLGVVPLAMDRARDRMRGRGAFPQGLGGGVAVGIGVGAALAVAAPRGLAWLGEVDALTVAVAAGVAGGLLMGASWIAARQALRTV